MPVVSHGRAPIDLPLFHGGRKIVESFMEARYRRLIGENRSRSVDRQCPCMKQQPRYVRSERDDLIPAGLVHAFDGDAWPGLRSPLDRHML
jgi:hypothetical protein